MVTILAALQPDCASLDIYWPRNPSAGVYYVEPTLRNCLKKLLSPPADREQYGNEATDKSISDRALRHRRRKMVALSLYGRLRLRAWFLFMNTIIRIIFRKGPRRYNFLPATADVRPQSSFSIPARADSRRRITVNVFYPPNVSLEDRSKLPVHLNAHGSGFCYKVFTEDSELCAYLAQKAGSIVLDTDYAKAPRYPFPEAYNDVSDVVAHILSHPESWDLSRFTMGGCSSGACLILSVAAAQAKGAVKSLQVWYPPVDLSAHESNLTPVRELEKGSPGMPFSLWERYRFEEAYVPDEVDREDPRLSPIYAPVESFPPVTIICGDRDPMLPSIRRFITKLKEGGNDLVEMIAPGCGHGFERLVEPDSQFAVLRDQALELCVRRMQESWAQ